MAEIARKTVLLTVGDSWTFGSEIVAPELCMPGGQSSPGKEVIYKPDCNEYDAANDEYRTARIWPTYLAKMLSVQTLINLAQPARSNDTIYEDTVGWILDNYISKNKDTSDLLVIVGWTSPERKNVIIQDEGNTSWLTLWPLMDNVLFYKSSVIKDFFKFYVTHQWVEQEYIKRFVEQNYQLQIFCKHYNIDYFVFNSFYQLSSANIDDWEDLPIESTINLWTSLINGSVDKSYIWDAIKRSLIHQWREISSVNYINKDLAKGSFKSYIYENVPYESRMCNWHPSPESHYAWAQFLNNYIRKIS
jgi:hypothetical protein